MAGDWLKVEKSTPEKPEVFAMSAALNIDPDTVFARLFKMWCWFDANTTDGNACGVTFALLDRHIGVTGFCNAALQVGWLSVTEKGICLPNFEYHNGQSAKERALTAKRVAKHRKSNGDSNGDNVTSPLAREEKRREELKEYSDDSSPADADDLQSDFDEQEKPKRAVIPYDLILTKYHEHLPELPRVAKLTPKRKRAIAARWLTSPKTQTPEFWDAFFLRVRVFKRWMEGGPDQNGGWWAGADFDFLMREEKFLKVVEENRL